MSLRKNILDEVISSIPEADRPVVLKFHKKALEAGFFPFEIKSDKKPNFYKIEYKKIKTGKPLFILHINGIKWSLRSKLFNLDKYEKLIYKLSEQMIKELLSSRQCKGKTMGCTAGILFNMSGKKYMLCRHRMHFRGIKPGDVNAIWELFNEESKYR
jgi:hypothetical protein